MSETTELLAAIAKLDARLGQEHAENRTDTADFKREVRASLAELRHAFPEEDPEGHRKFHDALIAEALERKKFFRELTGKLIERGIWAVVLFICTAVIFWWRENR